MTFLTGNNSGSSSFLASFIAGSINPDLYTFLGLSGDSPSVTGSLSASLNGSFTIPSGGSGTVAGASVTLDPPTVPEPSSLALLAFGLLSLAVIQRFGLLRLKSLA